MKYGDKFIIDTRASTESWDKQTGVIIGFLEYGGMVAVKMDNDIKSHTYAHGYPKWHVDEKCSGKYRISEHAQHKIITENPHKIAQLLKSQLMLIGEEKDVNVKFKLPKIN